MTIAICLVYAFMLGSQWGRIRTLKLEGELGERAIASSYGWWYRKPEWREFIHVDQELIPEMPRSIYWEPPKRDPFWLEQATVYCRWRARQWRM